MSTTINNYNVDILEKGADWNVSETDIPALIVNGSEISFIESNKGPGIVHLAYSGSVPIEGSGSRTLVVVVGVQESDLDNPEIVHIEEIPDQLELDIEADSYSSMNVGETRSLTVTRYKNGQVSQEGTLLYSSENDDLLTVDSNGVVTCVGSNVNNCNIFVGWFISDPQNPDCVESINIPIAILN